MRSVCSHCLTYSLLMPFAQYVLAHSLLILFVYSLFLILLFLFLLIVPVYSRGISLKRLGGRCRSKNNAQLARPRQCHFATGRRLAIWTCRFGLAEVLQKYLEVSSFLSFRLQNSNAVPRNLIISDAEHSLVLLFS